MNLPCAIAICSAALTAAASACQICVPFPQKSTADFLIEAEAVVLAREDPERPFHLKAIELISGNTQNEKIDLFLDSSTRRSLNLDPERSVVVVRLFEDGKPEWRRIGMADGEFDPLVRDILRLAPAWQRDQPLRPRFFSKFLGHENSQLSSLAHLEVGRASYDQIKALGDALSRDQLRSFLGNFRYIEWHSLYILLLAQSEDPRDRDFIAEKFRSARQFSLSLNLAAWATAAIEIERGGAIDTIEADYFRNPDRKADELEAVALALSVHGNSRQTDLRDRIVASYAPLIATHPSMTGKVALDLIAWKRSELAAEIASYVAANPRAFDFKTTLQMRAYGRQAAGAGK
ncbi:MAG: hypothetical protein ACR2RV_12205 [Verrucomicrobiales bacterium]